MANDILSLLGGMKKPTATESFAQGLLGYQRPSLGVGPMAQNMLGYQPSSIELNPLARTVQPSMMDRVSSGLGGIGSAFSGPGSNARLQALAASLLTGPSSTPISFGSQLAKGLLAGSQAAQAEQDRLLKRGLLEREMELRGEELGLAKEKLDVERAKLTPLGDKVVDPLVQLYNKSDGSSYTAQEVEDVSGSRFIADPTTGEKIDLSQYTKDKPSEADKAKVSDKITPLYFADGTSVNAVRVDQNGKISWRNAVTNDPITGDFSLETQNYELLKTTPFQNKETGQSEYIFKSNFGGKTNYFTQDDSGEMKPISFSDYQEPKSPEEKAASIPKAEKIYEFADNANEVSVEAQPVLNLMYNIDRAEASKSFGTKGWIQSTIAQIKTATNQELTDEEALRMMLTSNQSQVVGQSRLQILGPGVLSNQDVDFLFKSLGGNINSIFANPMVLKSALRNLYASKVRKYKSEKQKYDGNKQFLQGGGIDILPTEFFVNVDGKPQKVTGFVNPDYFAKGGTMLGIENMIRQNATDELKQILVM